MPRLFFLEPTDLAASLYPFTLTREVVDLPLGLLTLRQKWAYYQLKSGKQLGRRAFSIRANLVPTDACWKQLICLKEDQSLYDEAGNWLATSGEIDRFPPGKSSEGIIVLQPAERIQYTWDLLRLLPIGVEMDYRILTRGRKTERLDKHSRVIGKHPVFVEKGAKVSAAIFNTEAGPVYLGKNAIIQEGAMIRGPFLLGAGSMVTMGAKIYGATAVGDRSVVGGEVKRSLIFSQSNKAHEGYMGDSVIGSWCNWGAGTSNSNIKNTAGMIRVSVGGKEIEVGQKCGVFMGDHSRTMINTSLNSGSIYGVSVQVGNESFKKKRVSSFRWMDGKRYRFTEALDHIRNWKALKGEELSVIEIDRLKQIYKTDK